MSNDERDLKKLKNRLDRLETENNQFREENNQFKEEIKRLKKTVSQLEGKLRIYEGPNSPPSQKPVFMKKKSETSGKFGNKLRKKKGRKKGHKGSTLVLKPDREQNEFVDQCGNCNNLLDKSYQKHKYSYDEVEFPETVSIEVIRHNVFEGFCENCGESTVVEKQLKGTIFGPKLASFFSLLWYRGRTPLRGLSEILTALTNQEFSAATINNCLMTVGDKMNNPVIQVKADVLSCKQVHIDETGYISNIDDRELDWIWSVSTPNEVFYEFKKGRSTDDLKEVWTIDPGKTIAIVDGWLAYNIFPQKQRCWAHILRESHDLAKRRGGLAVVMDDELTLLFHSIKRYRELRPYGRNPVIKQESLFQLENIITTAEASDDEDTIKFVRKLKNASIDLLTAVDHPQVPLTNNHAERMLRPLVIHRKIRGFVASERGKKSLTNHATMFETWKLRKINPYKALLDILTFAS
ncbi:MAG: IS66 family transposase [Candidatus Heimdallarchaeota archaeon]